MKRVASAAKAAQQADDLQSLDARIAREQAISARIAAAKREVQATSEEESAARTKLRGAEEALARTRSRLKEEDLSTGREALLQERLVRENAAVAGLAQEHGAHERRLAELNDEITRLATIELPACRSETPASAVLAHQARVAEAAARLTEIDRHIATQEKALAALSPENLDQYEEALQAVLADQVMGKLDEADFARRKAEITDQRDAARQRNEELRVTAATVRRTIEGLKTRRDAVAQELEAAEASTAPVIAHFLRSEIEQLGEEYTEAALSLKSLFIRIAGLVRLERTYDAGAERVLYDNWADNFRLPALRVQACQGMAHPNWRGLLFSAEFGNYNSLWSDAMEAERTRVKALGVEL